MRPNKVYMHSDRTIKCHRYLWKVKINNWWVCPQLFLFRFFPDFSLNPLPSSSLISLSLFSSLNYRSTSVPKFGNFFSRVWWIVCFWYRHNTRMEDTTFTKVFVGGLAWETHKLSLRNYFEQFGDIVEAVVITDKSSGRSKGYGFVRISSPLFTRRF